MVIEGALEEEVLEDFLGRDGVWEDSPTFSLTMVEVCAQINVPLLLVAFLTLAMESRGTLSFPTTFRFNANS